MRFSISWREVGNLLFSTFLLGLLFSLNDFSSWLPNTLIVGLAFIVHELSHKFMAEHYDCRAEYVLWPQGIMLSVILSFLSGGRLIFAAIGFVSIQSHYTTRLGYRFSDLSLGETGRISVAGPVSNVVLGIILALFAQSYPVLWLGVHLNFILALFNLMPFPPLDGSKVMVWSRLAWFSTTVTTIIIYVLTLIINPLLAGFIGLLLLVVLSFYAFAKDF